MLQSPFGPKPYGGGGSGKRLSRLCRRTSRLHAKKGKNKMEPGSAQMKRYGLIEDAERNIRLSSLRSWSVHLSPLRDFINKGIAPLILLSSARKRAFSRILLARKEDTQAGVFRTRISRSRNGSGASDSAAIISPASGDFERESMESIPALSLKSCLGGA
jgi:hypothetical protein